MLADAIAADTKDGVHKITDAVKDESSHLVQVLGDTIRQRPTLTLGVAAGLGVLIGLILSARR
jgi:ElaB/YqjD/DUF883 family membrane-anchored ribosome-binding protein